MSDFVALEINNGHTHIFLKLFSPTRTPYLFRALTFLNFYDLDIRIILVQHVKAATFLHILKSFFRPTLVGV